MIPATEFLASPKARRMAKEAGLDLSVLVKEGLPQPFHAAEVSEAIAKAGQHLSSGLVLQINARVPTTGSDTFLQRMHDEAGAELSYGNLALAFAARALRQITDAETLKIALRTPGEASLIFTDPDRMRLSAMTGRDSDKMADLTILDLGNGYLTGLNADPADGTILVMSRADEAFHLTLSFRHDHLTIDQSILMMRDLTERLAEPMLALV